MAETENTSSSSSSPQSLLDIVNTLQSAIGQSLFGLERPLNEILIAFMSKGHILLEDVPGVGKTALARSFAQLLGLSFHRIQCTPDLLPSDILGGLVYHAQSGDFNLRKGPIFANILLVDEINRALPRTQSALLEAMAEGQVTIDGESHRLPQPFMVIATQNPLESQGVFPLPEAQLDRFLMKTSLGYPSTDDDVRILSGEFEGRESGRVYHDPLPGEAVSTLAKGHLAVTANTEILKYISQVVHATREHPDVHIGASPRSMIMLANSARAAAALAGRTYVIPDDVQRVAPLVLFHRLVFRGYTETEQTPDQWVGKLLQSVPVPLDTPQS